MAGGPFRNEVEYCMENTIHNSEKKSNLSWNLENTYIINIRTTWQQKIYKQQVRSGTGLCL